MKKVYISLFIVSIIALSLSACSYGAKPVTVPCPADSNMTGDCQLLPGSEQVMANKAVPVALDKAEYVEVTAPERCVLKTHVSFGYAHVVGEGTNTLKIYRIGQGSATVDVSVATEAEYPIEITFNGYAPFQP